MTKNRSEKPVLSWLEEDRLHEVVSHFIEGPENPITRRAASPPAPPKPDRA